MPTRIVSWYAPAHRFVPNERPPAVFAVMADRNPEPRKGALDFSLREGEFRAVPVNAARTLLEAVEASRAGSHLKQPRQK